MKLNRGDKIKVKNPDLMTNLREGNISLILDFYDDIFSDFDPRDYSEKSLSDDFLAECKKAAIDKKNKLELRLLVPKQKRNLIEEVLIKKRLREHFHKHFKEEKTELNKIKLFGLLWFLLGTLVIIGGTFLYPYRENNFFYTLVFIISEPASWFFFWEGLYKIFIISKKSLPYYNFYRKMSNSEIHFIDY